MFIYYYFFLCVNKCVESQATTPHNHHRIANCLVSVFGAWVRSRGGHSNLSKIFDIYIYIYITFINSHFKLTLFNLYKLASSRILKKTCFFKIRNFLFIIKINSFVIFDISIKLFLDNRDINKPKSFQFIELVNLISFFIFILYILFPIFPYLIY